MEFTREKDKVSTGHHFFFFFNFFFNFSKKRILER